jgi:hypothetical protein
MLPLWLKHRNVKTKEPDLTVEWNSITVVIYKYSTRLMSSRDRNMKGSGGIHSAHWIMT